MKSRIDRWVFFLAGAALSVWLPSSFLIPLVVVIFVRILFSLRKQAGVVSRDRFRDSLRTAERVLESI